jgi:hypothetical protein
MTTDVVRGPGHAFAATMGSGLHVFTRGDEPSGLVMDVNHASHRRSGWTARWMARGAVPPSVSPTAARVQRARELHRESQV